MEIKRVFDILEKLKTFAPKDDILNAKENKQWKKYSLANFTENANYVSSALINLGLKENDVVAIMSNNCPQWNFVDFGAQQAAVLTAPVYPTISSGDLKFILNHSEAKVIFISDKNVFQKLQTLAPELLHLKHIFSFAKIDGARHFDEFIELGKSNFDAEKINSIKKNISEDDIFTLLYTSGTTGQPKGVMVSHKNFVSNIEICKGIAPFTTQWRALSFLPLNHVYERFLTTLYLFHGVSIFYAESFESIGENCREIHPQVFVAVPRLFEVILEKILAAGEKLSGLKKRIFDLSVHLAEQYELDGANGWWYEVQRKFCDRLVYKKWRDAVGGEILLIVSGGAALNPRIERIFTCAGLALLQGYGLTETCVVVAVNRYEEKRRKFGTVGIVVENSQVKIAEEDGEILMKGPSLMRGYYKNEEATKEVIDNDGWFHTGDVGTFVDGKFLKITDRKKEIFKNSAGKYIAPVAIENKLKECNYIQQCMVIGEGQKFVSAIIIPSISNFKKYAEQKSIPLKTGTEIGEQEELKTLIFDHIKKINSSLGPFEQLKRCRIISGAWTVEGGEITPKLSLKRKVILEKNKSVIQEIFRE